MEREGEPPERSHPSEPAAPPVLVEEAPAPTPTLLPAMPSAGQTDRGVAPIGPLTASRYAAPSGVVERPRPVTVPAPAAPAAPTPGPPIPPARVSVVPMPTRSLTSAAVVQPGPTLSRPVAPATVDPPPFGAFPPGQAPALVGPGQVSEPTRASPPPVLAASLRLPPPSISPAPPPAQATVLRPEPSLAAPWSPRPSAPQATDQPAWLSIGVALAALAGAVVLLLVVILYFIILPNAPVH